MLDRVSGEYFFLLCVTFRRLSVVINSIDSYVAVFALHTDSQTYTQVYFMSQWHALLLQHLIFHISLSLSFLYICLPFDIFSLLCSFPSVFAALVPTSPSFSPPPTHHHRHHHRVSLSRQSSSALGSPVLIYCQIFQDYQ